MVVNVDWGALADGICETEIGHVRTSPWAIDREEPKHGCGQVPEVGIGMRHRLIGLFGGRIDRQLMIGLMGFGIRHLGVGAIGRAGGGHEQVIHFVLPRDLHHVEGADNIAVDVGARVFQRIAHTCLAREVNDDVWLEAVGAVGEGLHILEHRLGAGELSVLQQHLMPPLFEFGFVVICHAVKAMHMMALVQQKLREVIADKACGAGDEDFGHGWVSFSELTYQ